MSPRDPRIDFPQEVSGVYLLEHSCPCNQDDKLETRQGTQIKLPKNVARNMKSVLHCRYQARVLAVGDRTLKFCLCGFNSHRAHFAARAKAAKTALNLSRAGFDSRWPRPSSSKERFRP